MTEQMREVQPHSSHEYLCYDEAMPKEPPVIFRPPESLEVLVSQEDVKPLEKYKNPEEFCIEDYISDYNYYHMKDVKNYKKIKKCYQYYDEHGVKQETNCGKEAKEKSFSKFSQFSDKKSK